MKIQAVILSTALLAACATPQTYQPRVDTFNTDMNAFHRDLAECRTLASNPEIAKEALGEAAYTAAAGAATGAVWGSMMSGLGTGEAAGIMAATGAVLGLFEGAANANKAEINVIRLCLQHRGHQILK